VSQHPTPLQAALANQKLRLAGDAAGVTPRHTPGHTTYRDAADRLRLQYICGVGYRIILRDADGSVMLVADAIRDQKYAMLFDAAPDLLAACEEIVEHGTDDWDARMRTIRAAIARAKGGVA
jgi:glyoxylase-like metal-dependent hydrolase (beta-lactamase superfamily II)